MQLIWQLIIGWVALFGIAGFFMMGIDKARAQDGDRRIPEMTLFSVALLGGAFGVILGSEVFRHKTRKDRFLALIMLASVAWVVVLAELSIRLG